MSYKLKVDLISLLIAFDKYGDGASFENFLDELISNLNVNI
ncbi:hypothetical protein [Staphylococcus equorum]|nr:hypothetical protein [Staphylococcus equorum]